MYLHGKEQAASNPSSDNLKRTIAKRHGCSNYSAYRESAAQSKGFANLKEYEECLRKLRKEGFRGDLRVNPESLAQKPPTENWVSPIVFRGDDYYQTIYRMLPRKPRGSAVRWAKILAFKPATRPPAVEEPLVANVSGLRR